MGDACLMMDNYETDLPNSKFQAQRLFQLSDANKDCTTEWTADTCGCPKECLDAAGFAKPEDQPTCVDGDITWKTDKDTGALLKGDKTKWDAICKVGKDNALYDKCCGCRMCDKA